jgi:hypothetical protein
VVSDVLERMVGIRFAAKSGKINVKDRDRNPARSMKHPLSGGNDFRVCRVLVGFALTTIESFDNLPSAENYMNRIAARVPGSYVVFSKTSRQVVAKVVFPANASEESS